MPYLQYHIFENQPLLFHMRYFITFTIATLKSVHLGQVFRFGMSLVIVSLIYGFYIEFQKGFFSFERGCWSYVQYDED